MHHACTVASIQAELPTAKQWGWQWFPVRNAAQKKTEQGGDQPSFTDLLACIPQKFVELFEQGKLVRTWAGKVVTPLHAACCARGTPALAAPAA